MDLKVVKLSDANKWALLEDERRLVLRRQAEAEAMLSRLRQLSPELAVGFKLKESALADLPLRTIHSPGAEILRDPNATVQSYVAVSYCWHNKSWKPVEAAQPMTEWGLSLPMVNKILEERSSEDEGVWLDNRCLDQKNHEEVKAAVGAMDIIYRACRRLLVVLEDVQLT